MVFDDDIAVQCLNRISDVFNIPASDISLDSAFGSEMLASSSRSDFYENELDVILIDVQEMAKALRDDVPDIHTPREYCNLMNRVFSADKNAFEKILYGWKHEKVMQEVQSWRRLLYRLFGV